MTQLENVNTTDILDAIRLGCLTMQSVFNPQDNDFPHFASQVLPSAFLDFSRQHGESHVPGRHLNALLTAEAVAGMRIDEDAVEKHARALFFSFSGPIPLPMNRDVPGGPLVYFNPHNIREGLHGLFALVRYRHSEEARKLAEKAIEGITALWRPDQGWHIPFSDVVLPGSDEIFAPHRFIGGVARAIGPLVKYFGATSYGPALELAQVLKDHCMAGYFPPDGSYDAESHGSHTHSTTCVLSSLAQLATATKDAALMSRVKAFYDNGLRQIRDELGWVIENAGASANPDRGEVNNTGDVLETALLLGRWGHGAYFDDAELILRGHLLPSQLRDISFIEDPPNPLGRDGLRDVARRHLGAFGFPAPYGHQPMDSQAVSFNMDIVGGAVGSLAAAYSAVSTFTDGVIHVNLLFDHVTDFIEMRSPYTKGYLAIRLKRAAPLFVRLPGWLNPQDVECEGWPTAPYGTSGGLLWGAPPINRELRLRFPLRNREMTLVHRTRSIRVRLRGDQVVRMDNFGSDLAFFASLGTADGDQTR